MSQLSVMVWGAFALLTALRYAAPLLGGWLAATLDRKTPLVATLALGLASALFRLTVLSIAAHGAVPVALLTVYTLVAMGMVMLGGILRVATHRPVPAACTQERA